MPETGPTEMKMGLEPVIKLSVARKWPWPEQPSYTDTENWQKQLCKHVIVQTGELLKTTSAIRSSYYGVQATFRKVMRCTAKSSREATFIFTV